MGSAIYLQKVCSSSGAYLTFDIMLQSYEPCNVCTQCTGPTYPAKSNAVGRLEPGTQQLHAVPDKGDHCRQRPVHQLSDEAFSDRLVKARPISLRKRLQDVVSIMGD